MANDTVPVEKLEAEKWRMDAAAFNPDPAGFIKLADGAEYPIYSFLDVSVEDSLRVIKLADELQGADYEGRWAKSVELIQLLNAGLETGRGNRKLVTEEQLRKLAPRQMVTLTVLAMSIAQVPLKADGDVQSASASSAPSPAGSTDGPTAS